MVFRQEGSAVMADTVMKFKFSRNNNAASMKRRIEAVLRQILNKFGNLETSPSTVVSGKYLLLPFYFNISLNVTNPCFKLMRNWP